MHELSIAESLVEVALDSLPDEPGTVSAVYLKLGELAGVEKAALHFGYDIVTAGTRLEGSQLIIEDVPVRIYCPDCQCEVKVEHIACLRCPQCNELSFDIRTGKELYVSALDFTPIDEPEEVAS